MQSTHIIIKNTSRLNNLFIEGGERKEILVFHFMMLINSIENANLISIHAHMISFNLIHFLSHSLDHSPLTINFHSHIFYYYLLIDSFQMFLCKILYLSALLLILVPLIISLPYQHHHDVQKRSSFFDIDCKGELNFLICRQDFIEFCNNCWPLLTFRSVQQIDIFSIGSNLRGLLQSIPRGWVACTL